MQKDYWVPAYHYLSPFYSPCVSHRLRAGCARLRARSLPDHWFIPFALLILPFLLRLPADLLLLPQGLLPLVLALAAGLRGRRAARQVHR